MDWMEEIEEKQEKKIGQLKKKLMNISNARGLVFLVALIMAVFAFHYRSKHLYLILTMIFLLVFAILVNVHRRWLKAKEEGEDILKIVSEYKKKKRCDFSSFEFNGTEYYKEDEFSESMPKGKTYLEDLHIIGENSLFTFLNTAVTKGGRFNLFQALSQENPQKEEILLKQEAVEELCEKKDFIILFQEKLIRIVGIKDRYVSSSTFLKSMGTNKKKSFYALIVSALLSVFTIAALCFALFTKGSFAYFNLLVMVQLLLSFVYNKVFYNEFESITKDIRVLSKFKDLFEFVMKEEFKAKKNSKLKQDFSEGRGALKKLNSLDTIDSLRKNIFSYILFNIFFGVNSIIVYKYYSIAEADKKALFVSIKALEEMEMLLSLCTVNLVKEKVSKPEILDELFLECEGLVYPLIREEICISNDFQTGEHINIITGSNMSGKTSFMRAVGVNLVLSYAGAFVNAGRFSLPIMHPFTSINVKDDISKGISTFYGELLRIKAILDFSNRREEAMVVFIDEIFKGTNYADRIFGAKKVLERLSQIPCVVFLTTHDFELCEIQNSKLRNYHFSEEYVDGKMVFSHKIKTGKAESTNAKELMKEIGIV